MKVLIVEDDLGQAEQLRQPFGKLCRVASSFSSAMDELRAFEPDVVILDAYFPHLNGRNQIPTFLAETFLAKLEETYESRPGTRPEVILISGHEQSADHFQSIDEWLSCGRIADVLPKGISWRLFQAVLGAKVARIGRERRLHETLSEAETAFLSLEECGIITADPGMQRVWKRIQAAARSGEHTFIVGEVGVGKEALMEAVCKLRRRATVIYKCKPSYEICASELFGTRAGPFTDVKTTPGLIEKVGDGVLCLDEFGTTSHRMQEELLRLLQSREYVPQGGDAPQKARCMFVFADNLGPLEAFKQGKLIQGIAGRVSQLIIEVPPLRNRRGDIPLLIDHFLGQANKKYGKNVELASDVYETFKKGGWRFNNIRSLRAVVHKLVLFAEPQRYDMETVWSTLQGEDRSLLETELAYVASERHEVSVTAVLPPEADAALTCLKTELFGSSHIWPDLCKRTPAPEQKCDIADQQVNTAFDLLRFTLLEHASEWVRRLKLRPVEDASDAAEKLVEQWLNQLRDRLQVRKTNDPAAQLYYVALLYLVLREDHRATREDLIRILGRGYAQIAKLTDTKVPDSLVSIAPQQVAIHDEGPRKMITLGSI
jgi:two-component system NtrC family response regulator